MFSLKKKGDWHNTFEYLESLLSFDLRLNSLLNEAGQAGVDALQAATPKDTGLAASSWGYTVDRGEGYAEITWHNYDIEGGYNVAILVQYGHGTRGGTYVTGRDFVNPAMLPVFEKFAEDIYKEVTK